jgi:hypothetical protein
VNCFNSPSGPVKDKPCSLAIRTSSAAASCSAEGLGFFFGLGSLRFTSLSVAVITAPSRQAHAQRVRPETPLDPQSRARAGASCADMPS